MAPRSGNRRRHHDDPYTFDDPYIRSPPTDQDAPAYEYVGTDEPVTPGWGSPSLQPQAPDQDRRRRPSPHRRYSRTTSPPRRSRHDRALTPPPESLRHSSSPRHDGRDRHRDSKPGPKPKRHRYQDITQNPNLRSYGKKGMTFLGEAAAALAAAQAGEDPPEPHRARSIDRDDMDDRRHRHRRRYTPSPSPSPPRRRHSTRHGDRDRDRDHDRSRDYDRDQDRDRRRHSVANASPPPLSRDPDSYIASRRRSDRDRDRDTDRDRDRDRDHGRDDDRSRARSHRRSRHSPSPSPPPSSRSRPRGRSTPSSGFRSGMRGQMAPPTNANAARWQMAARAALEAGGLTAFRLRKEPGNWSGDKAAKVATAALGAAAIDAFIDQDPRQSRSGGRGMKGVAETALSGFIASQIMGHKGSSKRGKSRY